MASKPSMNFSRFLQDALLAPYQPAAMKRLLSDEYIATPERNQADEDERDAEIFATRHHPEGCMCGNNGGGDCEWCMAKQDWLINDPEWRNDALED